MTMLASPLPLRDSFAERRVEACAKYLLQAACCETAQSTVANTPGGKIHLIREGVHCKGVYLE